MFQTTAFRSRVVTVMLLLLLPWMAVKTTITTDTRSTTLFVAAASGGVDFLSTVRVFIVYKIDQAFISTFLILEFVVTFQIIFILQREEILASRERRIKQIETLLEDSQQRHNDHKSGIRMLNEKELNDLERKIDIYTRKLESMMTPLDEREVQRIIQREEIRNERIHERRNTHRELQKNTQKQRRKTPQQQVEYLVLEKNDKSIYNVVNMYFFIFDSLRKLLACKHRGIKSTPSLRI